MLVMFYNNSCCLQCLLILHTLVGYINSYLCTYAQYIGLTNFDRLIKNIGNGV